MNKFFETIKSADLKQSGAKINQTQRNALSTELKDILSDFLKQFESDSVNIERVKNGVAISVDNDKLGFDVISAGTVPPNPGELIRSEKLSEMFDILRQRYTFLIIDSSPVGIVPDAMALIEQTDVTLYVLRCMSTDKRFAKQTLENLALHHKDKINLILSDTHANKSSSAGYGYGYGASYGYGYGYGYEYGYGYGNSNSKKKRYGFDYFRTKISKKKVDSAYKYVDDDED